MNERIISVKAITLQDENTRNPFRIAGIFAIIGGKK